MTQLAILRDGISDELAARRVGNPVKSGDLRTGERRWKTVHHAGMILPACDSEAARGDGLRAGIGECSGAAPGAHSSQRAR